MDKTDFIFGIRAVMEAVEAGRNIDKVLVKNDLNGDLAREMMALLKEKDVLVQRVPMEKLNRITMKNHQGVIAILSPVPYHSLPDLLMSVYEDGKDPFIVLLDGITDMRNFGAIARTADCAGVSALVIPERGSVSINGDAVKTSAGALMHLPVCRVKSIAEAVDFLKASGVSVVGATEKGVDFYTDTNLSGPVGIVMGAEDKGISNEVLRRCDRLARIPLHGEIGSLNVSVAAGIFMFEVVRQRGTN